MSAVDLKAGAENAQPHGGTPRCTASAKSTGSRCGQPVVPGAIVCRYHGGRAPQVAKAAARRVAVAEADRTLAALVPDDPRPVGDVATELSRLASEVVAARKAAARMVADLDAVADPFTGAAAPELALWSALVDKSTKLLGDMARLGIDARRQAVDENAAQMAATVIRHAMTWAAAEMRAGATPEDIETGWPAVMKAELRRLDAEEKAR